VIGWPGYFDRFYHNDVPDKKKAMTNKGKATLTIEHLK
jgi:hypothetical protein